MNKRSLPLLLLLVPGRLGAEESLDLRQAAVRALSNAPELRAARAQGDESAAAARLSEDAFHPELLLTASPGYASGLAVAIAGRLPAVASVELHQTLLDPSRKSAALLAGARRESSLGTVETARTRVATNLVRLYARVWLDGALLRTQSRRTEAEEVRLSRVEALAAEGRATHLDLEMQKLAVAKARQVALDAESDRDIDALELGQLVGAVGPLPPLPENPTLGLPEANSDGGLERAEAADPELQATSRALVEAQKAVREGARRFWPVVEAEAQYSRLYHSPSYDQFYRSFKADDWSAGLLVAFPILSGGRRLDQARQAQAEADRLREERRQREFQLEVAFKRAGDTLARSVARASLGRRARGCAEEALEAARARAEEGRGEIDEPQKAAIALAGALDEEARSTAEELVARAECLAARGELLPWLGVSGNP
jgi:outer membrane protein TolC